MEKKLHNILLKDDNNTAVIHTPIIAYFTILKSNLVSRTQKISVFFSQADSYDTQMISKEYLTWQFVNYSPIFFIIH